MTTAAARSGAQPIRSSASMRAMTVFGLATAVTFSAASAAPTPLYRLYQEQWHLSAGMLTLVFAIYSATFLAALLTAGSLSDYVGRRPVIFAALALNIVAMVLFIEAESATVLIAARVAQGFATGVATTTLGAAILDSDRKRGPLFNSLTAFIGLAFGSIASGALVSYAPDPTQLVYILLLAASALEALAIWIMPETAASKRGALASLKPHVIVPARARKTMALVSPVNIATWALGGFYFLLMPSLVRSATGVTLPVVGGGVVAALPFTGALAVYFFRQVHEQKLLLRGTPALALGVAVTLLGIETQMVSLMLLGTLIAGVGFGAVFSGILRMLLPLAAPDERAGLLSAFYVESYLAFSLPAVAAGLVAPVLGLARLADLYGLAVIILALASFIAMQMSGRKGRVS